MNWKNVYRLMQIERKSARMSRGTKTTKVKENKVLDNLLYVLAIVIGVVVGIGAWFLTGVLPMSVGEIQNLASGLFVVLPTFVLVASAVLTLLYQLQRSGVKLQAETPYWLPITWSEHTLASVLASLLGLPLGIVLILTSAVLVFSIFSGLIALAIATSIAMFAAAFLSSTFMEVLRVLQVRFTGAIYKSSGRGAIWVRFVGSLAFLLIFFTLYVFAIYGGMNFLSSMADVQTAVFFIPFVWLGLMLSSFFITGSTILGLVYLCLSLAFIGGMYVLAFLLNKRFGLYTPPAIKIQKSGLYTPKTGFLGKIGFSTNESAVIRKDFKAFTRRKELMSVFITPIIFLLIPFLSSEESIAELVIMYAGMVYMAPAAFMVMLLGTMIIGQEGQAIWRIYASPISAKNIVKSKYFFTVIFGLVMAVITGIIGTILYHYSFTMAIVGFLEAIFLTVALGAISVYVGFIAADFTEVPRPRMVRQIWVILCMIICVLIALVILLPLIPTVISAMNISGLILPSLNIFVATAISGVIATVIAVIFYKLTLSYAKDFLRKAEV
ncbi:MAG: ABC-2 transporter permease [Nitrososphaerota archaeon]|jgi:hypothetical protein|nr:ABC-2 transporter permease [Nitrososphaerota archaeon]